MKLSVPKRHIGKKLYTEIWKDIVGYEGLYQISNLGRVKSLNYKHTGKEKILKPQKDRYGYLYVILYQNGKRKHFKVHRLVGFAFVDGYFEGAEVDHINTIRDDNKVENLRFVTSKENSNNPLTKKKYRREPWNKEKEPVYCLELDKPYPSANQCAKELGLDSSNVCAVCKGKYKQTGGYHFYYEADILYKS